MAPLDLSYCATGTHEYFNTAKENEMKPNFLKVIEEINKSFKEIHKNKTNNLKK